MDFPYVPDFCPSRTRIEILRGDITHRQSDVQASISIDADELVNRSGTFFQKVYIHSVIKHIVPGGGRLALAPRKTPVPEV